MNLPRSANCDEWLTTSAFRSATLDKQKTPHFDQYQKEKRYGKLGQG